MAELSSGGLLSGASVEWTTAVVQQNLATPIVTGELAVDPGEACTADLLQQAMNEVSFDAGGGVSYPGHNGEVVYLQEDGRLVTLNGMIVSGDMAVVPDTETTAVVVSGDQHGTVAMDVSGVLYDNENPGVMREYIPDPGVISVTTAGQLTYDSSVGVYSFTSVRTSQASCPVQISDVRNLSSNQHPIEQQNAADDVPSGAIETDTAPLGSSQNPIRIIQRGNQYTAMQHLTPDQLTQILQVIQEQLEHAETKNPSSSSSAILCNPDSGSQVVYRITASSSSAETDGSKSGTVVRMLTGTSAEHSHHKRIIRKRKKDEEVRLVGSELSRQEKEERKKHRPRTRSGRVSKPPQHMVKDYKHIHPVDYDEDYDDSDGGYSDFKHSGDEADSEDRPSKDDTLLDDDHYGRPM